MSVFEDPDSCSVIVVGVESALLLAFGVPSEFVSAGRAWWESNFTLLCTDFRLFGVAFGDGRGLERLNQPNRITD